MNHGAAIAQLERDLRQLELDYNRYFAGSLELPPELFQKDLRARLRSLRGQPVKGVADRFRLNALTDRFNVLSEHFHRRLRELETGGEPRRAADERGYDPHQGIVLDGVPSPEALRALYDALYGQDAGATPFPTFRDLLLRQLDTLRAKSGCVRVRVRVELADGRPRLKARPVESAGRSRAGAVALVAALAWPSTAAWAAATRGLDPALNAQLALVEAQPADVGARNDLGNLLVLAGDPEAAAAAYREALRLDPHADLARYNLGLLELERGQPRAARRHFARLRGEEPFRALAQYRLGDIAAGRDYHARAVRHYERAFRLAPELADPATHPEVLFNRLADWARHRAYLAPAPGLRPRRYADPSRLAGLMMGEPAPEPAVPAEPAAPAEPVAPPD